MEPETICQEYRNWVILTRRFQRKDCDGTDESMRIGAHPIPRILYRKIPNLEIPMEMK